MFNHLGQDLGVGGCGSPEFAALAPPSDRKWLIQSRYEEGLNIHYHLSLVLPQGLVYEIKLPWEAQEICPICQGQGLTYSWRQDQAAYETSPCRECLGQGFHSAHTEISLVVSDGLGGRQVIRKNQGGRLNARLGLRGDLVVNLTWVESLSELENHAAPAPGLN